MAEDKDLQLQKQRRSTSSHVGIVTKTYNFIQDILERDISTLTLDDLARLKAALNKFLDKKSLIQAKNDEIFQLLDDPDEQFEAEMNEMDDIDNKISHPIALITEAIEREHECRTQATAQQLSSDSSSDRSHQSIRVTTGIELPQLKLSIFDGKYEEWTPFIDLFTGTGE